MKRVNEYFFGVEQIHPSDAGWFYGTFAFGGAVVVLVSILNFVNL